MLQTYNMNAMGIGQMVLYLGISIADLLIFGSRSLFTAIMLSYFHVGMTEIRRTTHRYQFLTSYCRVPIAFML